MAHTGRSETGQTAIGLIGLGVMGSAIGVLLIRSGAQVWGYDIAAARREQLRAAGGRIANSPAEVAQHCPVLLTSLPTAAAFREVVAGPDGLATTHPAEGRLLIELSTLALADKEWGQRVLGQRGWSVADVPLSGTGAQARTGDLAAFVSADRPADRARAIGVLRRFTRAQHDVGPFGNGSKFKYVANLLVAIHNVAAAEAIVLAERAGLSLDQVLDAVADGAGQSRMLSIRGPLMASRSYDEATVRLEVFLKDVALIGEFAGSVAAPTPLLLASEAVYRAALARGRSQQDTACVAEVLRDQRATPRTGGPGPAGSTS
jgi:L-threonate 2-dehydrogenase